MRTHFRQILAGSLIVITLGCLLLYLLARKDVPESITYGISFNVPYTKELGLDTREVYDAFLNDLGVRHLRLAAHWPLIEPSEDLYDFELMDHQIAEAEKVGAEVILGIGRRLPRWPECHVPPWAADLSWEEQKEELREYLTAVIERYKGRSVITYWQLENEPYLEVFAHEHCGDFDEEFFEEEIRLVRSLDSERPILVTDSGNLGTWSGAYKHGDAFGTSVYVFFWNPELGQFQTVIPPWFYRVKENVMEMIHGKKETFLIELSLEPWLLEPVVDVPIEVQYSRMDTEKFNEILAYARNTRYQKQYLWGGEWWYWLKKNGHPEMWERGKALFR